jgi:hypothetical protein
MLKKNIISSIEGKGLNGYILEVANLSRRRFVEETNFELFLKNAKGETSENPVVRGTHFSGRGEYYKPWLEIYYYNRVSFSPSKILDLSEKGLDKKMFKLLLRLIPPGAHIMVVYLNHEETRKGLERGVPPPATPIGYLLWKSGCTWFKDWYFAEGFMEGDVKLQGNKPLNEAHRRKNSLQIRKELTAFLKKEKADEKLFLEAMKRAENILKDIENLRKPKLSKKIAHASEENAIQVA